MKFKRIYMGFIKELKCLVILQTKDRQKRYGSDLLDICITD